MSSSKLRREYPNFAKYLDSASESPLVADEFARSAIGCLGGITAGFIGGLGLGFGLSYLGVSAFASILTGVISFPVWAALGGVLGTRLFDSRQKKKIQSSEDKLLAEAAAACRGLGQLDKQRKLHKWLDPVAGQLLEASALHWDRVHTILSGTSWQSEELGGHWVAIREKSLKAADLAMAEILMLCARCVGEPTKNRSDDWKDILEDFAELDFEDAIRGLNKAIATDSKSYKFTSPEARIVFEPARQIAERLKQLADQVEQSAQQAALEITIPHGSYATESIDVLLGEFRSISMAESELDSSQRLEH